MFAINIQEPHSNLQLILKSNSIRDYKISALLNLSKLKILYTNRLRVYWLAVNKMLTDSYQDSPASMTCNQTLARCSILLARCSSKHLGQMFANIWQLQLQKKTFLRRMFASAPRPVFSRQKTNTLYILSADQTLHLLGNAGTHWSCFGHRSNSTIHDSMRSAFSCGL